MHGWWSISLLPSLPLALQGWLWVLLKQLIFPNFWAGTVAACEDVCCLWAPNCFDHISLSVKKFWVHTQYMHVYLFINLWIYCIHALLKFQYFFLHPSALSHVPHLGDHCSRWSQYKWSLEAGGLILARSALFQGTRRPSSFGQFFWEARNLLGSCQTCLLSRLCFSVASEVRRNSSLSWEKGCISSTCSVSLRLCVQVFKSQPCTCWCLFGLTCTFD